MVLYLILEFFPGFLKDYEAVVSWFEVASLRRLAFLVFHKAIEM